MGEKEILNILKEKPNDWLDYKQLMQQTGIGQSSIMHALQRLRKQKTLKWKRTKHTKMAPKYYYKHKGEQE